MAANDGRKHHWEVAGRLSTSNTQAVSGRFPELLPDAIEELALRLDAPNTVTACSFCNSTTSRDISSKSMPELLKEAIGGPGEVLKFVSSELRRVLDRKRADVRWKLESVRMAFEKEFSQITANDTLQPTSGRGAAFEAELGRYAPN
jgi:hypothetical protein